MESDAEVADAVNAIRSQLPESFFAARKSGGTGFPPQSFRSGCVGDGRLHGPQFTHVAYRDFRVVRDNLKGGNRTTKDRIVPFCMFTDPELARVANETEAKRDKIIKLFIGLASLAKRFSVQQPPANFSAMPRVLSEIGIDAFVSDRWSRPHFLVQFLPG